MQGPTCSVLNQEALEARSLGEFLLVLVSIPRLTECASGVKKRNIYTARKFVHFTAALFPTWAPAPGGLPPPCCADERYDFRYVQGQLIF